MKRPWVVLPLLLGAWVAGGVASAESAQSAGSAALGRNVFRVYCASCHGPEARGDGTIAKYLTVRPADLTVLARREAGGFPTDRVLAVIDGRQAVAGHGNRDMPIWGEVFQKANALDEQPPEVREQEVRRRIDSLVAFLASIQQPAADPASAGP
jgi:mono/diheme cytochrome c family protein